MMDFASWLSDELKKRGWSQREAARRAGLPQSSVSKTISRERNPTSDICIRLAQALDVPPEQVLRLAGILPPLPASEDSTLQELIDLTRNLPPEDQKEILEYVQFRYQRRKG